ncbi:MAG: AAA family ATPase, partial [Dermatophilaceae bacterium]
MFGRARQLAVVDEARSDALAGHGRLLLITGEPGIGKSLLAQQAMDRAASEGFRVARGYAVDDAGAPPLWLWQRVGRYLPEVLSALTASALPNADDDAARFRLCEAVSAALIDAAEPSGLLVLLDDMHWADSLSLAVLRHVALDLPASRAVVVMTAREEPVGALARGLPDILRSAATIPMALSGLDVEAVTEWLSAGGQTHAWLPFASDLVRITGGNPFYIRSLIAAPPPSGTEGLDGLVADHSALRGVLTAPLLRLPAQVRSTIAVAAALAERLSPSLLAAATDQPLTVVTDHINAAVAAGLLRHGPTGLSFTHALVRDAVIAETPPSERAEGDAAIAAAMEQTQDPRLTGPSAIHWDRADGSGAAARCRDQARRAAALAAADLAHDESVRFARMSLRHARALGASPEDLAERLLELARYEWAASLLPDALGSCVAAVDYAEACGRADLMAQGALVPQGIGSVDVSRIVDRLCRRALARLPAEEVRVRAGLLGQRAIAAADEAADALSADAL